MKTPQHFWLALLSVLIFMSCGKENHKPPATDEGQEEISESSIIIPLEEAEQLYKSYGEKRVGLIEEFQNVDSNGEPIDPESEAYVQATRSLSIDYDTLKQYMAFVEQEAKEAKTEITGLRIYLGLYGANGKYPDAETVFINPLMEYGKKGNIRDDVSFAIQEVGGTPKAIAVGEILGIFKSNKKKGGTNLEMTTQSPVQSLAGNYFPKRPPPPPPSDPDYL